MKINLTTTLTVAGLALLAISARVGSPTVQFEEMKAAIAALKKK